MPSMYKMLSSVVVSRMQKMRMINSYVEINGNSRAKILTCGLRSVLPS